ncbi:16S rRNA (guanine(966)-N(2))-methyltransferase RsmD [Rheinheimera sp. 4Y26]|uniref:16S rRNA (guanine(966)-N(2))-methyltransferase RsmD n=1 Tax=Rheinheimera sp. 4Y26 TaxID=2977811 RepID=UPI0021B09C53|nr:16S rRNA (guanine(966)-N(2))-methyltransferase RsmD [Rheinheimera sp. 4Y26]MCT6698769.1 16S rRNA (guanine(966)-N(2))-methyltransferase RsmD [Rheinheimera sp. 4Y26]
MKARRPAANAPTHNGPGFVRIISGQWRGRRLPVLNAQGLRPTTDRVKETLFNWLMQDTAGCTVLDCFSGSGSLALEALSRHASFATLLELDKTAVKQLQQHLQTLKCNNAEVIAGSCLVYLQQAPKRQYDLVFLDPPFRQNLLLPCATLLEQQPWLSNDALIYVECEKELPVSQLPAHWRPIKQSIAGQLAYRLYQREQPE